jgi:cyanophycin synthetase
LRVLETSIYRGPNLFSKRPMVRIQLDLGELEAWPTHRLPDFPTRLEALLPGLAQHGCSYRMPGGFLRRMDQGTWLGHVIEHVALELQAMAGGATTRGKTRSVRGRPGVYNVLYQYADEVTGIEAGAAAIRLVAALLPEALAHVAGVERLSAAEGDPTDVAAIVTRLARSITANGLGPTTRSLVEEARRRGIPVLRLNKQSLIQLGYGGRQRRIRASVTGTTSLIGAELAGDKAAAKAMLGDAGLPVPRGEIARDADEAVRLALRLGARVVLKPLNGNHGRGITIAPHGEQAIRDAFARAAAISRSVIVERELPGNDHRILVVDGKMVAVAERVPAHVTGDGVRSIGELIEATNLDPRRGDGHENVLTRIKPDGAMTALLAERRRTLYSVPGAGEVVMLRGTANLSSGGTAIDRTDVIHPENAAIAETAAAIIGLDVAGVDFLSPDISRSVRETGGGIVEVNAAPGLRMHVHPSQGRPRDVARPIIASLFPPGTRSRIPIFAITGTNGKSTTVRMVARILCCAGLRVGMTSTSGVYIDGRLLLAADASGPKSARMVLKNPRVDAAVLESARGGILREGLGFDSCDVGAVLNVSADHLGIKGIETVEDLAQVKSVVTESVARRGHAILNADDPLTVRLARHAGGTVVWFSMNGAEAMSEPLRRHLADGGTAVVREGGVAGGAIVLHRADERTVVIAARDIPATLGGAAEFNIANALAAVAMTTAHGLPVATVADALRGFTTSYEDSPGRLNIHDVGGVRVIVDYAHNPAALTALGQLIESMRPERRRVFGMVSIPGDRRDEDLIEMGGLSASIFDEIMFREAPDGRGRPAGSINALMSQGAIDAGMAPSCVHRLVDEETATDACLAAARSGDLVVLMPTDVGGIWKRVLAHDPSPVRQFQGLDALAMLDA